jgi:hypothetical protein
MNDWIYNLSVKIIIDILFTIILEINVKTLSLLGSRYLIERSALGGKNKWEIN